MKSFKRYASLTLGGFVLVGSLSGCGKLTKNHSMETNTLVQEQIIQEMPCLQFSEPVEAIKIAISGKQQEVGYMEDGTPIYLDKYVQLDTTTTDLIIDGELIVCMDVLEEGKLVPKQFSAYRDAKDGSLVIFPNGVVKQELVGTEQASYEVDGQIILEEIPLYKSTLSFTTGQTVTETICNIDITEENNYILLSDIEESIQR